jgi:penicillin amidase
MIVDFSNIQRSLHVLPTGQSGHLKSDHYKDQIPLYLSGKYHLAWTNRADVEEHKKEVLILKQEL